MNTIQNGLACPFFHAKELIELMHFHPDLFLGFQGHDNQLAVLGRVEHLAKIIILGSDLFDVFDVTFHGKASSILEMHAISWRSAGQIPS
jgi:hypothetical protein